MERRHLVGGGLLVALVCACGTENAGGRPGERDAGQPGFGTGAASNASDGSLYPSAPVSQLVGAFAGDTFGVLGGASDPALQGSATVVISQAASGFLVTWTTLADNLVTCDFMLNGQGGVAPGQECSVVAGGVPQGTLSIATASTTLNFDATMLGVKIAGTASTTSEPYTLVFNGERDADAGSVATNGGDAESSGDDGSAASDCTGQPCVAAGCCPGFICAAAGGTSVCTQSYDPTESQCSDLGASCETNACCGAPDVACLFDQFQGYVCASASAAECSSTGAYCNTVDALCCPGSSCCTDTTCGPPIDVCVAIPAPAAGGCLAANALCGSGGSCCEDLVCIDDGTGTYVCEGEFLGAYPPGVACVADGAACKPGLAPCCTSSSQCQYEATAGAEICE